MILSLLLPCKVNAISSGLRIWQDAAGTQAVTTSTLFPIDQDTTLYVDLDPTLSVSSALSPRTVTLRWKNSSTGLTSSTDTVTFNPFQVVSRDKFLAGSITLRTGWDTMQLEFVNTTSGENLGRYGNLLGGGSTKIYADVHDILSEADVAAGSQSSSQKVWFVRSSTDPRTIDFYTCFNAVGTVNVRAYLGTSTSVSGSVTHTLTTASDFADWITYVDNWCNGVGFEFPDNTPPVGITSTGGGFGSGGGSFTASGTQNLNPLTRAALIPIFVMVTKVEGMNAIMAGMLHGVGQGLNDDWQFYLLVNHAEVLAGNWAWQQAGAEFTKWRTDPVHRAKKLMSITVTLCDQFIVHPLAVAGHTLASWQKIKQAAFTAWELTKAGNAASWAIAESSTGAIVDGLISWGDDFATRMLNGGELVAFGGTPWRRDAILNDLIGATVRGMGFELGYTVGYLAEQVVVGALTAGSIEIGAVLVRGGAVLAGSLSVRTAFMVSARLHVIKKWLAAATLSAELRIAVEEGLAVAARTPLSDTMRNSVAEVCEGALARASYDRAVFGTKHILDELTTAVNIQKLCLTPGRQVQVWQRFGIFHQVMGEFATENASKGWVRAYNRALKFEGDTFLEDRAGDLFTALKTEVSAEGRTLTKEALEDFATRAAPTTGHEAFKLSATVSQVYPTLYHYKPGVDFRFVKIENGIVKISEFEQGAHYLTPDVFTSSAEAIDRLQLPEKIGVSVLERARYRFTVSTGQIAEELKIPYSNDLANGGVFDRLEPIVRDNPQLGIGGATQFTTSHEMVVNEVFDTQLGRTLDLLEIQNLITNAQ